MENYNELRKYFYKEKSLSQDSLVDNWIHLCLYFVRGQQISARDLIYIRKLSKIVNIIPILVENAEVKLYNFEKIKLNAKRQLLENDVQWLDL
jgi:septin family protein